MTKMKKLIIALLLLAAFSAMTGCMGLCHLT